MPSYAVSCRRSTLVPLLSLAVALPLGAQAPTFGTDINAAADSARTRSPLFFGSAYVAPKGYFGVSLIGSATGDRSAFHTGQQLGDVYQRGWGSTVSAAWGATSRLTLGAQLMAGYTALEFRWPVSSDSSAPRRRQRFGTSGPSDVRVHARYQLLDAGATTLALNASLASPTTEWGYGTVGLALAQRVGRATLHVAPELRLRRGVAPFVMEMEGAPPFQFPGRTPLIFDLRSGAVFAITRRVSWSVEGMGTNLIGGTSLDARLFEVGTGLRVDLGKTVLDLGYRRVVWTASGPDVIGRQQFVIGTHWKF